MTKVKTSGNEKWRLIPSLPEFIASSHGRVMMVPAYVPTKGDGVRVAGGIPRKGEWDGTRYIFQFRGKSYKVHRLVCEAFHGSAPANKPVCMHLNENSADNRPDNLAWGTQRENLNAPGFIEYCKRRTGENSPTIKGRKRRAA